MQSRLFDQLVQVDLSHDPYARYKAAGDRLAVEYSISKVEAFDLVLGTGSEAAARRILDQRWWVSEDAA